MSTKVTTSPIVTGTSVCAIRTDKFVVMAADTLGSYGSMARYMNTIRIKQVGKSSLIGCGGEISDFQKVMESLEDIVEENYCMNDGVDFTGPDIHSYLTRLCYNQRSKMNPYYNQFAVAGVTNGSESKSDDEEAGPKCFLGYTDLHGTSFTDDFVATGMGGHIAMPLLRKYYRPDLTMDEAMKILEDVMTVLFYRDCRTINRMTFANVTVDGTVTIEEPRPVKTHWDLSEIAPIPERIALKDSSFAGDGQPDAYTADTASSSAVRG